jgi:hypothetical protein
MFATFYFVIWFSVGPTQLGPYLTAKECEADRAMAQQTYAPLTAIKELPYIGHCRGGSVQP